MASTGGREDRPVRGQIPIRFCKPWPRIDALPPQSSIVESRGTAVEVRHPPLAEIRGIIILHAQHLFWDCRLHPDPQSAGHYLLLEKSVDRRPRRYRGPVA
jgi:hypothetical protein